MELPGVLVHTTTPPVVSTWQDDVAVLRHRGLLNCVICVRRGSGQTPFSHIALDVLGPLTTSSLGNSYVLVVRDLLTQWVEAFALPRNHPAEIAACFLKQIVCRYRNPQVIHRFHGSQMSEALFIATLEAANSSALQTTDACPEGCNQQPLLGLMARTTLHTEREWEDLLSMNLLILRHKVFHPGGVSPYEALLGEAGILPETFRFTEAPQATGQRPATVIELRQLFETLNGFRYSVPIIPPGLQAGPLSLRPPGQRPQVVRMTTYSLAPGKCAAGPKDPHLTAGIMPQPQVPPPPLLLPRGYHLMPPTVLPPPPQPVPRSLAGSIEIPTPLQALVEAANRILPPLVSTTVATPSTSAPALASTPQTAAERGAWPGPPAPARSLSGGTATLSLSPLRLKKTSVEEGGPLQWRVQAKEDSPAAHSSPAPFSASPANAVAGSRPHTPTYSPAESGPLRAESLEFPPSTSAENPESQSLLRRQLNNTFPISSPGLGSQTSTTASYAAVCHEPRR